MKLYNILVTLGIIIVLYFTIIFINKITDQSWINKQCVINNQVEIVKYKNNCRINWLMNDCMYQTYKYFNCVK